MKPTRYRRNSPMDFWRQVDVRSAGECWPWNGYQTKGGYGRFAFDKKMWLAHRLSWFLTFGKIDDALDLCHHCDNPACVNPDHLFPGTAKVNMHDAMNKGRLARGELSANAKLNENSVREIRRKFAAGVTCRELAAQFGVDNSVISRVARRKTWKHVDAIPESSEPLASLG